MTADSDGYGTPRNHLRFAAYLVSDSFKTGPVSRAYPRNHDDRQNEEGWP